MQGSGYPYTTSGSLAKEAHVPGLASVNAFEETPVSREPYHVRQQFVEDKWMPFLSKLKAELLDVRKRYQSGFEADEVLFSQHELLEWQQECFTLTQLWHGRPNMSVLYEFLIGVSAYDHKSKYVFEDLGMERSSDGFCYAVDMAARMRCLREAREKGGSPALVDQQCGESMIDNTLLPNILPADEVRFIRVRQLIKHWFIRRTRNKQREALEKLGLCTQARGKIKAKLKALTLTFLQSRGVLVNVAEDELPFWWIFLRDRGYQIQSLGQFPDEQRAHFNKFLKESLKRGRRSSVSSDEAAGKLKEFVDFCWKHPGETFEDDPVKHKAMIMAALISPEVAVLRRSDMESFTNHRYLPYTWTREVPLISGSTVGELGKVDHGIQASFASNLKMTEVRALRSGGVQEVSRFRNNDCPYGKSHGLGLSSGGVTEGSENVGTFQYELGLMLADGEARVGNWYADDIEKIIKEAVILNPASGIGLALPGEVLHNVGQSVRAGSSIGATQHTHIFAGGVEDYPIWMLQGSPMYVQEIGAYIDIVQVTDSRDTFFLKVCTAKPDDVAVVEFLQEMRFAMLQKFGGHGICFNVGCFPVGQCHHAVSSGPQLSYVITVAPISAIEVPEKYGGWLKSENWRNPDTQEEYKGIFVEPTLSTSVGRGGCFQSNALENKTVLSGRPHLEAMYEFSRKPGARVFLADLLKSRFGYEDSAQKTVEEWRRPRGNPHFSES